MNVTLEDLSPCKKRVKIEIPANRVQQTYDRIAADFQKEARIPGFRLGHAPKNLVTKKYHKDIEAETQRTLMPEALSEVIKENKLTPVCPPALEDKNFVSGVSFVFTAVVEVAPKVTLPPYKGLKLNRPKTGVTEQEVDNGLFRLADQQATYEDITDRPSEKGDFLVIDYQSTKEGKPLAELFPGVGNLAEGTQFWLWTESPDFIPGFIDHCLGMNIADSRDFTVEFPSDFGFEAIAGQKVDYSVKLQNLKRKIPVVINDEFAIKIGATDLAALRKQLREIMEKDKLNRVQQDVRAQVLDLLLKGADFAVPDSILEHETENSVRLMVEENQKRGITPQMLEEQRDEIFKAAARDAGNFVRLNYIASEIARAENLKPSDNMVIQHLSAYAEGTKQSPKKVLKDVEANGFPTSVSSQITRSLVLEFVVRNAEFVEEEPAEGSSPGTAEETAPVIAATPASEPAETPAVEVQATPAS